MVKQSEILRNLDEFAPPALAMEYDNVGLLVGRAEQDVTKVLLCLDCDRYVVEEAVALGAQLIVTHHPVIFHPIKRLTDETPLGAALLLAAEHGISIFSAHTNLDSCSGGLTDYMAQKLNLAVTGTLEDVHGRLCKPQGKLQLFELCAQLKEAFGLKTVRTTAQQNRPVRRIALCNGGGGSMVAAAMDSGADVYITGDLDHHEIRDIYLSRMDYIEITHHASEIIVTELLYDRLKAALGSRVELMISKKNINPLIDIG